MTSFSWRTAVVPAITALALLSGDASKLEACCGWFGGGWGAGYAPAYTAGYYGGGYGYSSYYGPSYYGGGGWGSCCSGCASPCSNGCGSCGTGCGSACNSCGLSGYASAPGCSPCSGGNCGVTYPSTNPGAPNRPSPDDGFRSGTGGSGRTPPPDANPANDPYPPRRNTFDSPPAEDPTPPARTRTPRRNDGLDGTRGTGGTGSTEPESEPATDPNELPLRPKRRTPGGDTSDPFNTNRVPMPEADGAKPKSTTPPDDSFDNTDDTKTKTNRPNLGEPADADTIIPGRKKAAPTNGVELPEEEPKALNRDEKDTTQGVAPKTRLAISGRFGTPSIVRLKLRPSSKWLAEPQPEMIASH